MEEKPKILIIDDDPDVVFAVTAMLEASGFEALSAKTGIEGLERVRLDRPDLILLDLMIESHDTGFQVAKQIKGDPTTRRIPIIMVSAVRAKTGFGFEQPRDGHWMKTEAFLEKPYEPQVVIAKIRETLAAAKEAAGGDDD
jgi:CheY-like chemotaxis protein